jgi:ABC-type transporter MlaC component
MKRILLSAAFVALNASASIPSAKDFLKDLLDLSKISKATKGSDSPEARRLITALSDRVDFDTLARSALGTRWSSATPALRQDFRATLQNLLETVLYPKSHRMTAKLGDVVFTENPEAKGRITAKTRYEFEKKGELVERDLELVLVFGADDTRIVDAVIEGEVLSANLKRQFDQALQTKTLQQILDQLKKRVAEAKRPTKGTRIAPSPTPVPSPAAPAQAPTSLPAAGANGAS